MKLSLSWVIILGLISQIFSLVSLRSWGSLSDTQSNKTVLWLAVPLYAGGVLAWAVTAFQTNSSLNLIYFSIIAMVTGIASAGVNLALMNIGIKLAPKENTVLYLSAKNIITAPFSALGPILGGLLLAWLAPYQLLIDPSKFNLGFLPFTKSLNFQSTHYLFFLAALLCLVSLRLLKFVTEKGYKPYTKPSRPDAHVAILNNAEKAPTMPW